MRTPSLQQEVLLAVQPESVLVELLQAGIVQALLALGWSRWWLHGDVHDERELRESLQMVLKQVQLKFARELLVLAQPVRKAVSHGCVMGPCVGKSSSQLRLAYPRGLQRWR